MGGRGGGGELRKLDVCDLPNLSCIRGCPTSASEKSSYGCTVVHYELGSGSTHVIACRELKHTSNNIHSTMPSFHRALNFKIPSTTRCTTRAPPAETLHDSSQCPTVQYHIGQDTASRSQYRQNTVPIRRYIHIFMESETQHAVLGAIRNSRKLTGLCCRSYVTSRIPSCRHRLCRSRWSFHRPLQTVHHMQ